MRGKLAGVVGVWFLAGVALAAADFWEEKDFTAWSDKEVEKMLTDSPWAKGVRIVVGSLTEDGLPIPAQPSGPTNIPFDECGGEQFGAIQRHKITVSWTSALPIKQAFVRRAAGLDGQVTPESQRMLDGDEPYYTVTLLGLPPAFASLASMRDALKAETILKRKDKAPIAPEEVRLFQDSVDLSIRVLFLFPKTDAIILDDKDVELVTRLGDNEVKKKFKLADMVFGDRLEL